MEYRYSVDNYNGMMNSNVSNLKSFDDWKIIKCDNILSLYELLPDNLKQRIKQIIGMRMFYSDILDVNIPKNHDFRFPLVIALNKPPGIPTFKNYKIFASIYNESRNPYHNAYGIYIYFHTQESPWFVIKLYWSTQNFFRN
ncbi:hypothetical protein C2G38_2059681 [Gigaspora rosea]|uniref:Uncharacterized protein n=1 Tax=Gigaspora rosea TaxID=44941 RepID=A0A397W9V6_9GLOM|nr:hypothetical protein C2G38_2059681 [Gigaspora rosea]